MKKISSNIIIFAGLAVGILIFIQDTPLSLADHDSCSGTNYFSCITGGRSGSVGSGPGGSGGNFVNDPTPGGVCSCNGCLCVTGKDIAHETAVRTLIDIPPLEQPIGKTTDNTGKNPVGTTDSTASTPTTRLVSTVKIVVNTSGEIIRYSSDEAGYRGGPDGINFTTRGAWSDFYSGMYNVAPAVVNTSARSNVTGTEPTIIGIANDPHLGAYYVYSETPPSDSPNRLPSGSSELFFDENAH